MRTGSLKDDVSFEEKEQLVRMTFAPWYLERLDLLENRDHEEYVRVIEEHYQSRLSLEDNWEKYVYKHATEEQLNKLSALKGTDKYNIYLLNIYRGLVNREEQENVL